MRIKKGFELRDVCGANVIVGHGEENIDFSRVVSLNESAALIWHAMLGRDFTTQDMATTLTAEYEVDEATALADAQKMADEWIEIGLVQA